MGGKGAHASQQWPPRGGVVSTSEAVSLSALAASRLGPLASYLPKDKALQQLDHRRDANRPRQRPQHACRTAHCYAVQGSDLALLLLPNFLNASQLLCPTFVCPTSSDMYFEL